MRHNPGRLAWTVILTFFVIFCTLAVSIPWGIRWSITNLTKAHEAKVTCLEGTAVVEDPEHDTAAPLVKGETISVPEGTVVSVDETAEAVLTFFDQSHVRLFPSTSVSLERMRAPRFKASSRSGQIILYVKGGGLWISTALHDSSPVELQLETLQAHAVLSEDGSYTVEASNEQTEVIVQRGTAEVETTSPAVAEGVAKVSLSPRQRTVVEIGKPPLPPLKAERDLIVNGDFRSPLSTGWASFNDQGGDGGESDGDVSTVVDEGRRAVRFLRTDGQFNHCETIIEQQVDRDLPDPITTLKVRAMVKVMFQSLSGGGYLSSEYPLMIRVKYRDRYFSENEWTHGFYYMNVGSNPTMNGLEIPQGEWYFYESKNLLGTLPINPDRIVSVRVYASGWNYESLVSAISLIVE